MSHATHMNTDETRALFLARARALSPTLSQWVGVCTAHTNINESWHTHDNECATSALSLSLARFFFLFLSFARALSLPHI